jgi:hypothetical protein
MSRKTHPQSPHFGTGKLIRRGKQVAEYEQRMTGVVPKQDTVQTFPSIRKAKRYMRTGRADRG